MCRFFIKSLLFLILLQLSNFERERYLRQFYFLASNQSVNCLLLFQFRKTQKVSRQNLVVSFQYCLVSICPKISIVELLKYFSFENQRVFPFVYSNGFCEFSNVTYHLNSNMSLGGIQIQLLVLLDSFPSLDKLEKNKKRQ